MALTKSGIPPCAEPSPQDVDTLTDTVRLAEKECGAEDSMVSVFCDANEQVRQVLFVTGSVPEPDRAAFLSGDGITLMVEEGEFEPAF